MHRANHIGLWNRSAGLSGSKNYRNKLTSNKFDHRAPPNKILTRTFIGGAMNRELVELPDDDLVSIAKFELDRLLGGCGPPELARVYRWRNGMPQYHVGHLDRVNRSNLEFPNFPTSRIAGNSYRGVGIPVCVSLRKCR